jgi:hypothetical protein
MAKLPIIELPIDVYTPVEIGRPYLAIIRNVGMVFRANSPVKARQKADEWRRAEFAKLPKSTQERLLAGVEK